MLGGKHGASLIDMIHMQNEKDEHCYYTLNRVPKNLS